MGSLLAARSGKTLIIRRLLSLPANFCFSPSLWSHRDSTIELIYMFNLLLFRNAININSTMTHQHVSTEIVVNPPFPDTIPQRHRWLLQSTIVILNLQHKRHTKTDCREGASIGFMQQDAHIFSGLLETSFFLQDVMTWDLASLAVDSYRVLTEADLRLK